MTAAEVSLPKISKAKKVTAPNTAVTPEVIPPKAVMTYGEAIKLVAGVLRNNADSPLACEVIRDIVAGTGLDVSYEAKQEEEEQEI